MFKKLIDNAATYFIKSKVQDRKQDYIDKIYNMHKKNYDAQMADATSLFNRSYYRNYLESPTAQNMLKQVREQMDRRSKSLRNSAAVMGYTPESVAIMQQNNNRSLDSILGNLARTDEASKERALYAYDNKRSKLNEYMYAAKFNKLQSDYEINESRVGNRLEFWAPIYDSLTTLINDQLKKGLMDARYNSMSESEKALLNDDLRWELSNYEYV